MKEKLFLYFLIAIVPLLIYPFTVSGATIHERNIREIGLYSFAIVISAFLQKNRWLRYFIIWCVANWWLNFFKPAASFPGLTSIFSALVLYIGLKKLLEVNFLKSDIILKIISVSVIVQFLWMLMQRYFNYDPIFQYVSAIKMPTMVGYQIPSVGWSGNPSVLGVSFACSSFLLLEYFKIKKIPILFFMILTSIFMLKNTTTAMCFIAAGLFYIYVRYRISIKSYLLACGVFVLAVAYFLFSPLRSIDRLFIWKQLIEEVIRSRPFVGKGINYFSHMAFVDKTGTVWREAHNDYLQMIMELGIIGFILFAGFSVTKFIGFFKSAKNNKQTCVMACLVAFMTAGLTLFPLHLAQLSFNAIIMLCCLEHSYKHETF